MASIQVKNHRRFKSGKLPFPARSVQHINYIGVLDPIRKVRTSRFGRRRSVPSTQDIRALIKPSAAIAIDVPDHGPSSWYGSVFNQS